MAEVQGSLINFKVRPNGTAEAFKTLICTEDSQFDINNEVTQRRTNCGIKTSVTDPDFNASGNAVYDYAPLSTQVSWDDIKEWQKAKTKLDFQYENDADAGAGLTEAEAVSALGSGYFTATSLTASAESDGIGSFSWTFTGTGTLDSYDV